MPRVNTLDKSLSILETIFSKNEGLGTRTLAARMDLNVATVHNIARTFCERGYLRQDPKTKLFHPGVRVLLLGRHPSYLKSLTSSASPIVDQVAEDLEESVLLGSIDHGRIINLKYIPSTQALRVHEPEDVSDHSYCTAFGKVLLSSLSQEDFEHYLQETELVTFTPETLDTPERLTAELEKVREQGYAQTCDEYCEGISAVAVPIFDPWKGVIASIGASAPTVRMKKPGQFEHTLQTLRKAAETIENLWCQSLEKTPAR